MASTLRHGTSPAEPVPRPRISSLWPTTRAVIERSTWISMSPQAPARALPCFCCMEPAAMSASGLIASLRRSFSSASAPTLRTTSKRPAPREPHPSSSSTANTFLPGFRPCRMPSPPSPRGLPSIPHASASSASRSAATLPWRSQPERPASTPLSSSPAASRPAWRPSSRRQHPPVLVLHGDQDSVVPDSEALKLKRLFEQHAVRHQVEIFPGETHWFSPAAQRRGLPLCAGFLARNL